MLTGLGASAEAAGTSAHSPERIVVGYAEPTGAPTAYAARATELPAEPAPTKIVRLAPRASLSRTLDRLRREPGVRWAVPDYVAHAAGSFIPNDEGVSGDGPGGWEKFQWNFFGQFGVNAPEAWFNVAADGHAGGSGVIVAVLDTGVAYANRVPFRRSPDFGQFQFVRGYDFVARNAYPNDRNGHGTFVAATIAEETNNHVGLTGLAYGARIMPVRVLDAQGEGEASTIAEGIVFAVNHGAQVINLSLEFSPGITAADIPEADRSASLRAPPRRPRRGGGRQRGPRRDRLPGPRPRRRRGWSHDRTRVPGLVLQ